MAKTPTPAEAKTSEIPPETHIDATPEGQDTVPAADATPEGQDTVPAADATPEGQDAAGADTQPADEAVAAEAARVEAEMAALRTEVEQERLSALTRLAALITDQNVTGHRPGLISDLQDHWGAIFDLDAGTGTVSIEIYGIKTDPADSMETALTNWANAARRAVMEATA